MSNQHEHYTNSYKDVKHLHDAYAAGGVSPHGLLDFYLTTSRRSFDLYLDLMNLAANYDKLIKENNELRGK
jgi:hypothetical protein